MYLQDDRLLMLLLADLYEPELVTVPLVEEDQEDTDGQEEAWDAQVEDWDAELANDAPQPAFIFPVHLFQEYGKYKNLLDPF